ncbi:hypothetical protein DICPUDRAFT_83549 [Dictyostelium purpureum]|uniref:Uncharacterized protein n=1 Tax=Dictyostelium purpureum TaxID=5786 RepID=F0ZZV0_DICPU|nr:uncharacterized protein DICPUDRAFT_83549 [Dictyostelium purpureum]EGC30519.1 hypothetical protein DICPUDRAFT_83549 [Dictyostelium purpureum]|eukprot:XP_003292942.1 hypothetical protein DICPUDRAFT_83549 [Dictyostelium purpureum]
MGFENISSIVTLMSFGTMRVCLSFFYNSNFESLKVNINTISYIKEHVVATITNNNFSGSNKDKQKTFQINYQRPVVSTEIDNNRSSNNDKQKTAMSDGGTKFFGTTQRTEHNSNYNNKFF